jgi:hypothetical protein
VALQPTIYACHFLSPSITRQPSPKYSIRFIIPLSPTRPLSPWGIDRPLYGSFRNACTPLVMAARS